MQDNKQQNLDDFLDIYLKEDEKFFKKYGQPLIYGHSILEISEYLDLGEIELGTVPDYIGARITNPNFRKFYLSEVFSAMKYGDKIKEERLKKEIRITNAAQKIFKDVLFPCLVKKNLIRNLA